MISQSAASDPFVPPLREDLRLLPGGNDEYGAPCWTIHDPVRNRYFRIGYSAFEMLRRWHLKRADDILAHIRANTVLTPDQDALGGLIRFLHANGLLQRVGSETVAEFSRIAAAGRPPFWKWVLHNYLFFRVPLVHPDNFLRRTRKIADFLASPLMGMLILLLGGIGIFLTVRQWDLFVATFLGFANWQGAVWIALALTAAKILHEMGHAYSAARYGCRVPSMGVAFLVMYPVLYTDTSDAWRLTSKTQRLRIGAAGIRVELALAMLATFLWHVVPPGPIQSAVFLLASTVWITTLLVNLSPFMRFDGYYLLSDLLGIANLQNRSFAMARWTIREMLFRTGDAAPEPMPYRKRRLLAGFAVAVWIYRFFLFLGIAVVVYHVFFKLLGIVLFAIEIGWFIVLPVWRELAHWWKERHRARATPALMGLGAGLLAVLVLFFVPWQGRIAADAMLQATREADVQTAISGQLAEILVERGQTVIAGQPIIRMISPDLHSEHRALELQLAEARILLAQTEASAADRGDYNTRLQEMRGQAAAIAALEARQELLVLHAPFDGVVRELDRDMRPGDWLAPRQSIARIIGKGDATARQVIAYVSQRDIARIADGAGARFYPEQLSHPALDIAIDSIERFDSKYLEVAALASVHGGNIAAKADNRGNYTPLEPVFRITGHIAAPDQDSASLADSFSMSQRGILRIDAAPLSWARRLYEAVAAGFIREMNF